jgi:7-carboxy-7-deazaguanine synthase
MSRRTDHMYPIAEVFRSIQGEGHFVGYPMTFVRFAGCSLWGTKRCSIAIECDTEPTRLTKRMFPEEIANELAPGSIVVLTGGEPTDYDLVPFVDAFTRRGIRVHLETSGVRSVTGLPIEWITVSPKTLDYAQRTCHALKIVVRPGRGWDHIDMLDEGVTAFHRYLQPLTVDGKPVNTEEVIALLMSERNRSSRWALSVQAHRTWGVR